MILPVAALRIAAGIHVDVAVLLLRQAEQAGEAEQAEQTPRKIIVIVTVAGAGRAVPIVGILSNSRRRGERQQTSGDNGCFESIGKCHAFLLFTCCRP